MPLKKTKRVGSHVTKSRVNCPDCGESAGKPSQFTIHQIITCKTCKCTFTKTGIIEEGTKEAIP